FTPRRAKSVWSLRNIERFEALSAAGRVSSPGRAAYSRRTEDRSGVYSFEQTTDPELSADYLARLRAYDAAWRDWESRPPGYRKQVAHWVMSAKRESTRERRLAALIEDSAAGRKVKPLG
ncbi:MAG: YdeI/OmpD-associated family protein, partial [Gemmatimonadetes bacterium]|nr:YdeI/OmpD-associated family protein [Gemmatimonadota bacterium]